MIQPHTSMTQSWKQIIGYSHLSFIADTTYDTFTFIKTSDMNTNCKVFPYRYIDDPWYGTTTNINASNMENLQAMTPIWP